MMVKMAATAVSFLPEEAMGCQDGIGFASVNLFLLEEGMFLKNVMRV